MLCDIFKKKDIKKDTHNIKVDCYRVFNNRFIFLKEQCKIIFKKFKNF